MIRYIEIAALLVAAAALPLADQPAEAMQSGVQECPANGVSLRGANRSYSCRCAAAATRSGSTWGTDIYSDDSRICRAAVHAGAIGLDGGIVAFETLPGQSGYQASTRNGVASGSWGRWQGSLRFTGGAPDNTSTARAESCPANAVALRDTGQIMRCHCPASATGAGSVWGTDIYTDDSRICRAAVHAGAIGPSGGTVVIRGLAGRNGYSGSNRNGVASSNYGQWSGSFSFE